MAEMRQLVPEMMVNAIKTHYPAQSGHETGKTGEKWRSKCLNCRKLKP